MGKLQLTPAGITENVNKESKCEKAKVVGWSAFMSLVAGSYLALFEDLTLRANSLQNKALAGEQGYDWPDYFGTEEQTAYIRMFNQIQLNILNTKDAKELYYISKDWNYSLDVEGNLQKVQDGDEGYYTQQERLAQYKEISAPENPSLEELYKKSLEYQEEQYKNWQEFHDGSVQWFDTAACSGGRHIGDANSFHFKAESPHFKNNNPLGIQAFQNWYYGTYENPYPEKITGEADWSTDISLSGMGQINLADDFKYAKDSLENMQQLLEDCDLECQQKGSQFTTISIIQMACLSLIFLNGLLGVWGGWSPIARIAQTYCTFVAFLFQLGVFIACATMLFTPYALNCSRSMTQTSGTDTFWTMHDDFVMVVGLWSSQIFWMFAFLVIGLCGAYSSTSIVDDANSKATV